ncbi:MAG: hypothetical protein H0W45_11615 [Acidobacteria bacterium]|jgi:hypothetical protein|nr:hypothetical protein [Acidobacteriota bacterium]
MRILLLGLLFFAFQVLVYAQPMIVPFKREKEVIKIKDINEDLKRLGINENGYIDRIGNKCGDYFLYQEIRDQKIISFGVLITKDEYSSGVTPIERIGKSLLMIKLDDNAKVPTARYSGNNQMIIRISNKDYKEAACLPKPKKGLSDLIK